jgi:transcription antitermination factor NusG
MQRWLVIRTRPRWEKKVANLLQEKGVEVFCPLVKTPRQWSDRLKTIDVPLLRSFLFVRIEQEQRTVVRLTDGVVNFVYKNGKPVVVKERLLRQIRQFQVLNPQVIAAKAGLPPCSLTPDGAVTGKANHSMLSIEPLNIFLVAGYVHLTSMKMSTDKL